LKKPIRLTLSTLLLAAAVMPSHAQAPASTAQDLQTTTTQLGKVAVAGTPVTLGPSPHKVVIPELTEVPIMLKGDVQSDATKIGSELLFYVAKDVYGPGHTLLIARDTPVPGQIVEVPANPKSRGVGKLALRCDYVLAWDKTHIPLRAAHRAARGNAQTNQPGSEEGVVVDTIANSRDAKLPVGKTYRVYVSADTQSEALTPSVEQDSRISTALKEAFVLLKDGSWAIGLIRQVGKNYILTNSGGSSSVRISDVRSLEYLKDAGRPALR